jgi:Cu/Zn superoxide dismutase
VQKFNVKQVFQDDRLHLLASDINGPSRKLYVVIIDSKNNFLSCAKIRQLDVRTAKTFINAKGIKGEVTFVQKSKFEPTWLNFTFAPTDSSSLRKKFEFAKSIAGFKIHELPPSLQFTDGDNKCTTLGHIFGSHYFGNVNFPPSGYGTQDQYMIGDLTGKLTGRNKMEHHDYVIESGSNELSGIYWDIFLPLNGKNSIINRGFILNHFTKSSNGSDEESVLGCGSISLYEHNKNYQLPIQTLQILFRYPIVGKIIFRQPMNQPWYDTTVLIEYLIHADGSSVNNTENHQWSIHSHPPNSDFYSWQNRCISAGEIYNPQKVSYDIKAPEKSCSEDYNELCRLGDFARFGTIQIAGRKAEALRHSRKLFTDSNLPLSGYSSILGKSIVIFDKNGPVARGERLACSTIEGFHRRKIVAKDWYLNGLNNDNKNIIKGKLEMIQQSEYELTNVEVNFKDLFDNSGYHVHITPVEGDLEFPCENSTLYGHFNPRHVDPKHSPLPSTGSTDQYEMGDLSGKFGMLDGLKEYSTTYNDTELPLFGYESLLGRSIVVHKKEKMLRWACSTLERGYSPSEAREIRGIASFHNPNGFAFGYIRMTQLIGNDGSKSDTVIEIKLRHPGDFNRNITQRHNWQIFVNPVGVDATVRSATRCVAGGYTWNPYYTQLADPLNDELYRQECAKDNPLRCYVGDLTARVGTIDIGLDRKVVSDPNFPLEGDVSAIGRSIVIFGPNRSSERFACANIEPDYDIVKYVNIERPPRFVLAQFIEDVRRVMGLPEWYLHIDSRTTQILHGGACVAFKLHFKGAKAHQVEMDFSRLMSSGKLEEPSLYIPGYINPKRKKTIGYRICSVRDPNDKNKSKW